MKRRVVLAIVLAVLCVGLVPSAGQAAAPQAFAPQASVPWHVALVPADAPGFVRLTGCTIDVRLVCEGAACRWQTAQRYTLHNRDRVQGKLLRLGLSTDALGAAVTLSDGQGTTLAPMAADGAEWEIALTANQVQQVTLVYDTPVPEGALCVWRWELGLLQPWGTVDSAVVRLQLPWPGAEEMILRVAPSDYVSNGRILTWSYATLTAWPDHTALLEAPALWQREQALRAAGDHYELALVYDALDQAARAQGVEGLAYSAQVLGELLLALREHPENLKARLYLAALYQTAAEAGAFSGTEADDGRALNYYLLAAHELEEARRYGAAAEVGQRLESIYRRAAELSQQAGQLGSALEYLAKARQAAGLERDTSDQQLQDVMLGWGLDLARSGQVAEAIVQLQGVLSPRMGDLLVRYVPPFRAVQTAVELGDTTRTVRYRFQPYATSADWLAGRLEQVAEQLRSVPGSSVALEVAAGADEAVLTVRVPFDTLAALSSQYATIDALLDSPADLVAAVVAAPWAQPPQVLQARRTLLAEERAYQERADLCDLDTLWQEQAQYARWQLVELSSVPGADTREEQERQLAILALREQAQAWELLPLASHWSYYLAQSDLAASWNVHWGQERLLEASAVRTDRWALVQMAALGIALLGAYGLIRIVLGSRRRRRSG
jgi:hypothetical protein